VLDSLEETVKAIKHNVKVVADTLVKSAA